MNFLILLSTIIINIIIKINNVNGEWMTASGQILCNNQPLKYVRVLLMDKDDKIWGIFNDPDDTFGKSITDINGKFVIRGNANDMYDYPDPYLKVEYYYNGIYGVFDIRDSLSHNTSFDATIKQKYSPSINFGVINFNNQKCKSYLSMLSAANNYHSRTSLKLPMSNLIINLNASDNVVHSYYNTINVPIKWNNGNGLSYDECRYGIAYTVRNYYDGNYLHYLNDYSQYKYYQNHGCLSNTNNGFAFQEGWCSYWINDCISNSGNIYTIEGNVASALRKLRTKCISNDQKYVTILKNYPGGIHSFDDFNNKHYLLYNCKL